MTLTPDSTSPIELVAPTGAALVATLDVITAKALISGVFLCPGSHGSPPSIDPEYVGQSDVDWDSQRPCRGDGVVIYIDENGCEWLEHQLVRKDSL